MSIIRPFGHGHQAITLSSEVGDLGDNFCEGFAGQGLAPPAVAVSNAEFAAVAKPITVADVTDRLDAKSGDSQHCPECLGGEVGQMTWQIEAEPGWSEPAERPGMQVWAGDDELSAWDEQLKRFPQYG